VIKEEMPKEALCWISMPVALPGLPEQKIKIHIPALQVIDFQGAENWSEKMWKTKFFSIFAAPNIFLYL